MKIIYLLILILLSGCNIKKDIMESHAKENFYRIEFDTIKNGESKKEIGISNFWFFDNESFNDSAVDIYGIYQGTIYLKSSGCGIDATMRYKGKTRLYLRNLIPNPVKCEIELIANVDAEKLQHEVIERGVIKINVIPANKRPLKIAYKRLNSIVEGQTSFQNYSFEGQGSLQRKTGGLTLSEVVNFQAGENTNSGLYKVIGCGNNSNGTFTGNEVKFALKNLYKKDLLETKDSCDLEIDLLPYYERTSYLGRFSFNVYGENVVKLEAVDFKVDGKYLKIEGPEFTIATQINDDFSFGDNKQSTKYDSNSLYWLRAYTEKGRKSILGIKNNLIVWRE